MRRSSRDLRILPFIRDPGKAVTVEGVVDHLDVVDGPLLPAIRVSRPALKNSDARRVASRAVELVVRDAAVLGCRCSVVGPEYDATGAVVAQSVVLDVHASEQ